MGFQPPRVVRNVLSNSFKTAPHRTLIQLSVPVLGALIAEPVTGLIDTGFVSRLGTEALAALGVGTMTLSSIFWVFNFLAVGAQSNVAQALGRDEHDYAREISSLSLLLGVIAGVALLLILSPFTNVIAGLLGAEGAVERFASDYVRFRLLGAPAVLVMLISMGVLRGLQDMKPALWIAVGVNLLNIVLDWFLIFGNGPFPALGVGGSGLASSISQWCGAGVALFLVYRRLGGLTWPKSWRNVKDLLVVGRDLFLRTALLLLYITYATRVANRMGAEVGAAHQAIIQIFVFTALFLEAYATTAQSLVGFFIGAEDRSEARNVVKISTWWSVGTGVVLTVLMLVLTNAVISWLNLAAVAAIFIPAWIISAISLPTSSVAFITDGVHWGTMDYAYIRNGMFLATTIGVSLLTIVDVVRPDTPLAWIWGITAIWTLTRGMWGIVRIFPGVGDSPFYRTA